MIPTHTTGLNQLCYKISLSQSMSIKRCILQLIISSIALSLSDDCQCGNDYLFSDSFCGSHWGDPSGLEGKNNNETSMWCYLSSSQGNCSTIIDGNKPNDKIYPPYGTFEYRHRVSKLRASCNEATPWLENPPASAEYESILPSEVINNFGLIIDIAISDEDHYRRVVAVATEDHRIQIYRLVWYTNYTDMSRAMQWSSYNIDFGRPITKIAFHPNQPILVVGGIFGKLKVYSIPTRGMSSELFDYNIAYEQPSESLLDYYGQQLPFTKSVSSIAVNNNYIVVALDRRLFSLELGFNPVRIVGSSNDLQLFHPHDIRCNPAYCSVLITGVALVGGSLFASTSDGVLHTLEIIGNLWSDASGSKSGTSFNPPPLYRTELDILRRYNSPRGLLAAVPDTDTELVRGIRKWTAGYSRNPSKRKQIYSWWLSSVSAIRFETASSVESFVVVYRNSSSEEEYDNNTTRTYTIDIYGSVPRGNELVLRYRSEVELPVIPEENDNIVTVTQPDINPNETGIPTNEQCWEFGSSSIEPCLQSTDRCLPLDIHNPVNYSCLPSDAFDRMLQAVYNPAINTALSPSGSVLAVSIKDELQILVSAHDREIPSQKQPPIRLQNCTYLDSSGIDDIIDCMDGSHCPASNPQCCTPHGGIARCPPEAASMCVGSCQSPDTLLENRTICCQRDCSNFGSEVTCTGKIITTSEQYTLKIDNLRPIDGMRCIPGFDQIDNEEDCFEYAKAHTLRYHVLEGNDTSKEPSCFQTDDYSITWNAASTVKPFHVMPKSISAIQDSFIAFRNFTLNMEYSEVENNRVFTPYSSLYDRYYSEISCQALCLQDDRCFGAITVTNDTRSCFLFNKTNIPLAGVAEEDIIKNDVSVVFIRRMSSMKDSTKNDQMSTTVGRTVCEAQRWIPLNIKENCLSQGLYEIRTFLECIRSVEYLRNKNTKFKDIMQPQLIRISSKYPGCMLHINPNGINTVTYNLLSAPDKINNYAVDVTICGTSSDWKPTPHTPTVPPPDGISHGSTLIYLPTPVYIVIIFAVLGCLVGMAIYALGRRPGYVLLLFSGFEFITAKKKKKKTEDELVLGRDHNQSLPKN